MSKDYSNIYQDWKADEFNCGPNKYIAGNLGDSFDAWDDIVVYYNRESSYYYLDQTNPTKSLPNLIEQLSTLLKKLQECDNNGM